MRGRREDPGSALTPAVSRCRPGALAQRRAPAACLLERAGRPALLLQSRRGSLPSRLALGGRRRLVLVRLVVFGRFGARRPPPRRRGPAERPQPQQQRRAPAGGSGRGRRRAPRGRVRRGRPGPHSRRGEPVLLLLGGRAGAKALGPPDPPPATGDGPRASKAGPCRPPAPPGAGWEKRSSSVKT